MKVEQTDFYDGSDVGCEGNRGTELISRFWTKQLERWGYIK